MNKSVMLIGFHNKKALGIRYLERALDSAGINSVIVFFKDFNSVNPHPLTQRELNLLKTLVEETNPDIIGLSVMSSLYLETVYAVNNMLSDSFNKPLVWGGVFPTLFPEKCLEHADYVIRGEGEYSFVELILALQNKKNVNAIPNLSYIKSGATYINDTRPLCQNLDMYGYPVIGGNNKYYINKNTITKCDPQLDSVSYELSASRGCPFACSYCSSNNLRKIYKGKGSYVRFRSVSNVMDELNDARTKIKHLKVIHFWDEIFSDDSKWIEEFTSRYKKEIKLPFEIWGHPLKTNKKLMNNLVNAGLYKVVMGIQSGSVRIRKEIFNRSEKQEDIVNASRILHESKIPQVIYDFMLQHPFETDEDIKQSYEICTKLTPPFELQLHGLNFLPGTDIVNKAVEMNIMTDKELDKIMYSPLQKQYDMYWGYKENSIMSNFWYSLTYMTQFGITRPMAKYFAKMYNSDFIVKLALKVYRIVKPLSKLKYFSKKGQLILTSIFKN